MTILEQLESRLSFSLDNVDALTFSQWNELKEAVRGLMAE